MSSTLSDFATAYFNAHLDKTFWAGLSADTKAAALAMAENDVVALLDPGIDPVCDAAMKAKCEQAVYLARNYENQNEGKVQTGEGLDGLTSNYTLIGTPGIAPRAEFFIKLAKKTTSRTIRIGRG
jgi:hypothetical protein